MKQRRNPLLMRRSLLAKKRLHVPGCVASRGFAKWSLALEAHEETGEKSQPEQR